MKTKDNEEKIRKAIWRLLLIAMLIFVFDHLLKNLSSNKCFLFLCLKHSINTGAAFSLFAGFPWIKFVLIVIASAVLIAVVIFYFKCGEKKLLKWALPLIFAGTLSNLLDRIFLGYAIDSLTFSFWASFPAFNIADASNLVGVVLLIIYLIKT
ncbi:MAG: signal peptidase II [Candidatus Pacearchaeota archaeon]